MTNVAVVGIDPSSRKIATAISLNGGKPALMTRMLMQGNVPVACYESFVYVRRVIERLCVRGFTVYLFVEEPVFGRGGAYATIAQAKTHGAMIAGGVAAGAEVHTVNNQTWKKSVVGRGNAGKPEIKKWVHDCWPILFELAAGDQDLIDAGCILAHGQKVIEMKERIERAGTTQVRRRRLPIHR